MFVRGEQETQLLGREQVGFDECHGQVHEHTYPGYKTFREKVMNQHPFSDMTEISYSEIINESKYIIRASLPKHTTASDDTNNAGRRRLLRPEVGSWNCQSREVCRSVSI